MELYNKQPINTTIRHSTIQYNMELYNKQPYYNKTFDNSINKKNGAKQQTTTKMTNVYYSLL